MPSDRPNALISVANKEGIVEFARGLHELGWNIYGSAGTVKVLAKADKPVPATDIATLVGGDPILGHKVVTLSREISAGLLADLNNPDEITELHDLGIPIIHLVCQDSYPLESTIAKPESTASDVLRESDIGGPTMLREAAKGRRIVLSVAKQREQVLAWLKAGKPDEAQFLETLAARAVYEVARYTMLEAKYWNGDNVAGTVALIQAPTKYGENPQQAKAALYADNRVELDPLGIDQFVHTQGMELSYINLTDIDRLLQISTHIAAGFERNFKEVPPMAVGVKHGNACGAAVAATTVEAVKLMLEGDSQAIFGGVVMINGAVDKTVADALMHHGMGGAQSRLLDGIIAAGFTDEALELLTRKKLRLVTNPALANLNEASLDSAIKLRPVRGGMLAQPNYTYVHDFCSEQIQTLSELTDTEQRDIVLAWAVGSTSNSNTITLVKNGQLIGNGVGQQSRVGAVQLALSRTSTALPKLKVAGKDTVLSVHLKADKLKGSVAYSDSFFPFPDAPKLLANAGISAILTSSGSVKDSEVFATLNETGVKVVAMPDTLARGFYSH